MIVRQKMNWFARLFVWQGSVLPTILPRLLVIFAVSLIAVLGHIWYSRHGITLNATPFSLIGVALAIFLSFRNSAAYDRFWEGRKLWGALLNVSRSLARQARTLTNADANNKELEQFNARLCAFVHALRHQLRKTDSADDMKRLLTDADAERVRIAAYQPSVILLMLGEWIKDAHKQGKLSDILVNAMETNLNALSDILGGCERIDNTPIPYVYGILLHRTTYFYCTLLPFGLTDSIGWLTPIISIFVAYAFMALDAIAEEIEQPFGTESNDLPLTAMSYTIERSVKELGGQTSEALPKPIEVNTNYILQ